MGASRNDLCGRVSSDRQTDTASVVYISVHRFSLRKICGPFDGEGHEIHCGRRKICRDGKCKNPRAAGVRKAAVRRTLGVLRRRSRRWCWSTSGIHVSLRRRMAWIAFLSGSCRRGAVASRARPGKPSALSAYRGAARFRSCRRRERETACAGTAESETVATSGQRAHCPQRRSLKRPGQGPRTGARRHVEPRAPGVAFVGRPRAALRFPTRASRCGQAQPVRIAAIRWTSRCARRRSGNETRSPMRRGNRAHRIGRDIRMAREGFVATFVRRGKAAQRVTGVWSDHRSARPQRLQRRDRARPGDARDLVALLPLVDGWEDSAARIREGPRARRLRL